MGPVTWLSIYFVVWWTVLFVILPLGIKTHEELGEERHPGADWGAPPNPNIKKKFITTTWVSAIVLAMIFIIIHFGLVRLPELPNG